jgi:hypothetical protein
VARSEQLERKHADKVEIFEELVVKRNSKIEQLQRKLRDIAYGTNQYPIKAMAVHGAIDDNNANSPGQAEVGVNLK